MKSDIVRPDPIIFQLDYWDRLVAAVHTFRDTIVLFFQSVTQCTPKIYSLVFSCGFVCGDSEEDS